MARQRVGENGIAGGESRVRIQEIIIDDFFSKQLPDDGFTIEQKSGEYRIISSTTVSPVSAFDHISPRYGERGKEKIETLHRDP